MSSREKGRVVFQPSAMLFERPRNVRPSGSLRPGLETLECRQLLTASLQPISNVSLAPGTGFQVPLVGPASTNQTYTVISDNPQIKASVSPGKFLTINVTHASSGVSDPAFSGSMAYQLFDNLTPIATSRIEELVNQGFYTGKNFHRVANNFPGQTNFIVQGGSVNGDGTGNVNQPGFPFQNEILPQLTFNGTFQLAMANAGPNTNESQFFVTTGSPLFLDGNYTIFGQLVAGQNIVQDMTKVALNGTTPVAPILMSSATLSTTNPNGVINVSATGSGPGQVAHLTVIATDPSTHTTASQNFTVSTSGTPAPVKSTGAVRLIGQVLVVSPPVVSQFHGTLPYTITVDQVSGNLEVTVNGVTDPIQPAASSIQYLVVYGNKGNDTITITPNVTVPATIDGGHGGNNVLSATGGGTTEHGWFGFNRFYGGSGDSLIGRAGRVKFLPSGGETIIFAGIPHVHSTHTFPPSGQFYTFAHNKLIPISGTHATTSPSPSKGKTHKVASTHKLASTPKI